MEVFAYSKLRADTALVALVGGEPSPRIYSDLLVPQAKPEEEEASYPFVSFGILSMLDRNSLPATFTLFTMPVLWCRVTVRSKPGPSPMAVAYPIVERIDQCLRGQFGNVVLGSGTYYVGPIFRRAERTLPVEYEGSVRYITAGIEMESRVQRLGA